MNVIHYIVVYPLLFASLFALGLAVCRLKVTEFMYPTLVCVVPLSLISVLVQYYGKAYLMGFIQPYASCWATGSYSSSGSIIPYSSASSSTRRARCPNFYLQPCLTDSSSISWRCISKRICRSWVFCMIVTNVLLYLLLHRLRWGISFIFSAVSKNRPQPKLQGAWNVLLTGLFFHIRTHHHIGLLLYKAFASFSCCCFYCVGAADLSFLQERIGRVARHLKFQ